MTRPKLLSVRLSLLLLLTISTGSLAQTTVPARDSLAIAREDSVREGRNWLSGLLRRIGRRSDDSLQLALAPEAARASEAPLASPVSARAFSSRKDSVAWENARRSAARAAGFHLVVDVFGHQVYVIDANGDTVRKAAAATASNATLDFGGRQWFFETPRGVRTVTSKDSEPVWRPPDWHFAEVALEHGLKVRYLKRGHTVRLQDGTKLKIEGDEVGIVAPGEREFQPLVLDMHIVFDNTLFVPPLDTKHRQVEGELGHFRLRIGEDGYMLHGTPYANSIGASVTHGCVRLHDDDIEWLYNNVPIGTKVYIY